jgi:ABC-type transport system involved in multi-copper enzyme maturation permease subunit
MHRQDNNIGNPGTIRLAYWEALLALRSGGVLTALGLFWLLLSISLALGVIRTQTRQENAREAEQENVIVKEIFHDVLTGTPESPVIIGKNPGQDLQIAKQLRMTAKSPYLVSHSPNLWSVSLFPSPLSALSAGASGAWPDRYRIRGLSLSETVRRSDQIPPAASVYGPFDTTFVVMVIAPLVVIGLAFNISSRDRESNLQNLVLAQSSTLGKLMAVRCFVRAAMVIVVVVVSVSVSLLIAFGDQFDLNVYVNLAIWNVVATLYLLIWASLCLFVNSFAKSSSANGAALLLAWLILVLIIPRIVSNSVEKAVPTLPESELAEREKETVDRSMEVVDELFQRFQLKHPEIELRLEEEQQRTLAGYLLSHGEAGRKAAENVLRHYSGQALRARYLEFCEWLSPAISYRNQSDRCSGNSEGNFVAFAVRAANVQAAVAELFILPALASRECTPEIVSELPVFQEMGIPKRLWGANSVRSVTSMLVWLIILTCFGIRKFQVTDVRKRSIASSQNEGVRCA